MVAKHAGLHVEPWHTAAQVAVNRIVTGDRTPFVPEPHDALQVALRLVRRHLVPTGLTGLTGLANDGLDVLSSPEVAAHMVSSLAEAAVPHVVHQHAKATCVTPFGALVADPAAAVLLRPSKPVRASTEGAGTVFQVEEPAVHARGRQNLRPATKHKVLCFDIHVPISFSDGAAMPHRDTWAPTGG